MAGDSLAVKCKREPAIAVYVFNATRNDNIMRRIALSSITLAVILCLPNHTIAVQSAAIDRINGELLNITNPLKVGVESRKHDR
jgi:hypothetical protein